MVANAIVGGLSKPDRKSELFALAGCRYWIASILPAIIGTVLPFWLKPPGFSFKWFGAIEFLMATILFHAGFSLLLSWFDTPPHARFQNKLLSIGIISIVAGCLIGIHIHDNLVLHTHVYRYIFLIYGAATIFTGFQYTAPPIQLWKKAGGEVLLAVGLGMLPVLGAYLVQVGDLTRTVYLASLPVVASTALWVWIAELVSREHDLRTGRATMIKMFPPKISGRIVPGILIITIFASLIGAVIIRSSLHPVSIVGLAALIPGIKILTLTWNRYTETLALMNALRFVPRIYIIICLSIIFPSLLPVLLK